MFGGLFIETLVSGIILWLSVGAGGAAAAWLTTDIRSSKLRAIIGGLIIGLIVGLVFALIMQQTGGPSEVGLSIDLYFSLVFGLLFGLGMILSAGVLTSWVFEIQLRERVTLLKPARQRVFRYIKQGGFYGLFFGLIFGLVGGLVGGLIGVVSDESSFVLIGRLWAGLWAGLGAGLLGGLLFGSIGVLSGFVLAFLDTPLVDKRPKPGEGVRASLKNGLKLTLLGFGVLVVLFPALFFSIIVLPLTFTWFGGLAWCQHKALRVVLARQDLLPSKLVPWLDSMVALGLLRRVGGGYIFIHRSLLEYFAELEEW